MKRYGAFFLSASLALILTACGTPTVTDSSQIPDAYSSTQPEISEGAGTNGPVSSDKTQARYEKLVSQVQAGNFYTAMQTYRSGGSALAEYADAADYGHYAQALFYYHVDKKSSCLGQPYLLLSQLPSDFLSTKSTLEEIQTLIAPYNGIYTTTKNGVDYRISIQNGLLSSEVLTAASGDLGNYQSQLIHVTEESGPAMYSTNLTYSNASDLNYRLTLKDDGQKLEVENAEGSPFDVFVGTYEKVSDVPLDARK